MLRFIVKEVDSSNVTIVDHRQRGWQKVRLVPFDGDQEALERFLRYGDCPDGVPEYLSRELLGVELL